MANHIPHGLWEARHEEDRRSGQHRCLVVWASVNMHANHLTFAGHYKGDNCSEGVVTLSLIYWNLPTTADFDAWDFSGLACRSVVHIGPISINVTTPAR
jgi:hypothetical protein